ncbi:hypothetical protein KK137_09920 [Croceibacterium sp. LX-88]|uniref:Uncharacterized protein n=1 Tax=Croceibacterium selenioxidans TaxID=2838833 RepID=A0ABS5W4G9_9SPHN|nr:hypothetical protein [Croceibacterium selenioxidans]MBT2134650.1 hypothetical protein [Croceibacterium selenioxidans]
MAGLTIAGKLCAPAGKHSVITALAGLAVSIMPHTALAQSSSGYDALPLSNARICNVVAQPASAESGEAVHAWCWGNGVVLGAADRFTSSTNIDLETTVIEIEHQGRTRVLLVRPDKSGQPLVEDFSGTLAASVGRVPWDGLAGLTVALDRFMSDGTLAVTAAEAATADGFQRRTVNIAQSASEVRIADHLAHDSERATASAADTH